MFIVHKYKRTFRKYPLDISSNSKVNFCFIQTVRQNYRIALFCRTSGGYNFDLVTITRYQYKQYFLCVIRVESCLFTYDMTSIV